MKALHAKSIVFHKMNQSKTGSDDRIIGPFEYKLPHPRKTGAICPWHYENTPSLILDFGKQTAACLSCGVESKIMDAQWEEDGFAWAWVKKIKNND